MKKVTILALHLGYGGIENAVATLANLLCEKYEVEILSVYRLYNEPVFDIDERVKIKYISNIKPNKKEMKFYLEKKNFKMFFKGIGKSLETGFVKYIKTASVLRKLDCDVIISTRTVHNMLVSKFAPKKIRKIAWEHNHHNNNKKYINSLVKSCKGVNNLVLVSNELTKFYGNYLGKKAVYIPNCLDKLPNKLSKLDSENLISVGRLSKEKGFDDLLKLFKTLSIKHPNWKLNIVGDGMERGNLLELAEELKLGDKVIFHGYQNKEYINELLLNSSIYVMTSHTESFGLVLIEAMSHGLPCIAFSSAEGARELIDSVNNGYLIKNRSIRAYIKKVEDLMADIETRKTIGKNARKSIKKFTGQEVIGKWLKILEKK